MRYAMDRAVARLVLVPSMLVALALLVRGYTDVGDGFAAGVIAATGVVLQFIVPGTEDGRVGRLVRHAPALGGIGLGLAVAVGFAPLLVGAPPFTHRPRPGSEPLHVGSVEVTTAFAFDVGVFLLVFGVAVAIADSTRWRP